jgi:hypothetical protein
MNVESEEIVITKERITAIKLNQNIQNNIKCSGQHEFVFL